MIDPIICMLYDCFHILYAIWLLPYNVCYMIASIYCMLYDCFHIMYVIWLFPYTVCCMIASIYCMLYDCFHLMYVIWLLPYTVCYMIASIYSMLYDCFHILYVIWLFPYTVFTIIDALTWVVVHKTNLTYSVCFNNCFLINNNEICILDSSCHVYVRYFYHFTYNCECFSNFSDLDILIIFGGDETNWILKMYRCFWGGG